MPNTGSVTSRESNVIVPQGCRTRCPECTKYRKALNSRLIRRRGADLKARVKANSHTNYKWLSSREVRQRLQALHSNTRSLSRKHDQLTNRVMAATEARGIPVDVDLHTNLVQIMSHSAADVLQDDCPVSFGRVFWEAQQRAASLSDSRSMRWDPLMIMWCVYLHHLSSTAYETLRRSGIVHLPSQRTLRDYTHHNPCKIRLIVWHDKCLCIQHIVHRMQKHLPVREG